MWNDFEYYDCTIAFFASWLMVYIIRVKLYTREQEYKSVVIKLLVIKQFEFILKNMLNNFGKKIN